MTAISIDRLKRLLAAPALAIQVTLAVLIATSATSEAWAQTPAQMLPDDIRRAGRITVATDPEYEPCEFIGPHGGIIGFEPDLWNAMGAKLGIKIVPVATTFSGIISGVQSGRYTAAMSCISDSPAREARVTFVDSSYSASAVYALASNGRVTADPYSLCGLKTAAPAGNDTVDYLLRLSAECVRRKRAPIVLSQFPSANATLEALISNRVDFVVADAAAADHMRAQFPVKLKMIDSPALPKPYSGIIVQQQATGLANALLAALEAIQADGTYARAVQRWRVPFLALNNPGINLATKRPLPLPFQ